MRAVRAQPYGPLALALVAGALLPLAFSPFGFWPLAIFCPALLMWLCSGATARRAALLGFAFGAGTFGAGTWWLYVVDPRLRRRTDLADRGPDTGAGCADGELLRAARLAVGTALALGGAAGAGMLDCPRCGSCANGCGAGSCPASPGSRSVTRRPTRGCRPMRRCSASTGCLLCCWCRAGPLRRFSAFGAARPSSPGAYGVALGRRLVLAARALDATHGRRGAGRAFCRVRFRRMINGLAGTSRADHGAVPRSSTSRRSGRG